MTEATTRLADASWLERPPLARLLAALDADGEEARVNGGAVRDALLGLKIGEVDIATTALPEEVTRRAKAAGWKVAPTGIDHGTVTVVVAGEPFEVTTLRRDVATDGRRAVVAFTRDWAEDARRRDLTINGLYLDRRGVVHDTVGGLADLQARRVRFIGSARERIREDFLRTLRFFRFHARFAEGEPDKDGFSAAIAEREGLRRLSGERVRAELLKLLVARRAPETVAVMAGAGLFAPLLGGAPRPSRLRRLSALDADTPDGLLRLCALMQFVVEDAARLRARLKLSNAEGARLDAVGDLTPRPDPAAGDQAAKAALYRQGAPAFRDRVRLAWADAGAPAGDEAWAALLALPGRWAAPVMPVAAADLMGRGVTKGPALGRALKAVEASWIAAGFPEDPEAVQKIVNGALTKAAASPAAREWKG
ncbi:CCA tRNA nucleotidyltransferase [Chelatococcus sambhunathii]|uniref:CCA tRNA nucleotidyltransferase n=1 Tax=Chelatococcus sambhunathii TaxID=363953 RepID=A0ABU1DLC0_9HYPH|nr:CCA tRNA nucleotidyltransferase [Chelatococcus sambhunathii]MDR4308675.1 CCA tRNA nucleotidyltransferase [Chelatococcus sambhunathii]